MTEKERKLGVDYVVLKGRGDRDKYNGATCQGDKFIHLGLLLENATACGKAIDQFFLTYDEVEIDCLDCIKALKKKADHL